MLEMESNSERKNKCTMVICNEKENRATSK